MFGLIDLVVRAERDLRDKPMSAYSEPRCEPQVWLWRHKLLLLATGVLALLIVGGSGI